MGEGKRDKERGEGGGEGERGEGGGEGDAGVQYQNPYWKCD